MTRPPSAPRVEAALSWSALLSTYLPAFILALGVGIALPAIPTLAKSFDVGFAEASGVVTAFLLGNLAGTIPSGWLIDRVGRRPVMIAGPLLTALSAFLVVFSHSFPQLLILRFISGFAAQMWLMARIAAISHGASASQRGRLVTWMFGMDMSGALAGPVIGASIAVAWGPRAPFAIYGALALLSLVPTILFATDTPRDAKAKHSLARSPAPKLSWKQIIMPRLPYFGVSLFAGLTRGPLGADLLHLYAAFAYHLGPAAIGALATGAALLALPLNFLSGWILDHFGRKRSMLPGFGGVAVTMIALAVSAYLHLNVVWYVSFFYLLVIATSMTGGSVQTMGADVAPAQARGAFLGMWRFVGQGGTALSPIIFALLADQLSYGTAFVFIALTASVVVLLLVFGIPATTEHLSEPSATAQVS